jgi:hypothetical protein
MKLKEKYKLIPNEDKPDSWGVQLKDDFWHGIIYSYGEVSINENKCKFETDIIFVPERFKDVKYTAEQEKEFKNLLGEILIDIINENIGKIDEQGRILIS